MNPDEVREARELFKARQREKEKALEEICKAINNVFNPTIEIVPADIIVIAKLFKKAGL